MGAMVESSVPSLVPWCIRSYDMQRKVLLLLGWLWLVLDLLLLGVALVCTLRVVGLCYVSSVGLRVCRLAFGV